MTSRRLPFPKSVIFDLDGTLVDSAGGIVRALNEILKSRGGGIVGPRAVRPWISLGAEDLVRNALGTHSRDGASDLTEFRSVYFDVLHDETDLYPGALACVEALKSEGLRIGVCTNKPQHLAERVLTQIGLSTHLDAVVGARPALPAKPAPEPARLTLLEMKADPDTTVFVGDSEVDAATAFACGLPFVLARFGYPIASPDSIACRASFDVYADLPDALCVAALARSDRDVASDVRPQRGRAKA